MPDTKFKKLISQLENLHPKYIDLSLDRIKILLDKLGNPHLKLPPTIHIAGTNGKGSTLSFLNKILKLNNYKVHCYISPHLESIEERFIINDKIISRKKLLETLIFVKKINNNNPITFFEITTAAAFYLFSKNKADFLILETGLGGRYDATNVIQNPIINIITSISFDHKEFLGTNIKKIANEKLGIIKKNSDIVIAKQNDNLFHHIKNKIKNYDNKNYFYNLDFKIIKIQQKYFFLKIKNKIKKYRMPALNGIHQIENASTSIFASTILKKNGYKIKEKSISLALTKTKWPGRLEKFIFKNVPFFLDGAHNLSGAEKIRDFLIKENKKTWIVLGMLNNKDLNNFLKIIKKNIEGVIAVEIPDTKNCFKVDEIYYVCQKLKIKCVKNKNIKNFKKFIFKETNPKLVIITGSLYLIGKLRKLFV